MGARVGNTPHNKGKGKLVSNKPGPAYPYFKWGKWWVSEEAFKKYYERERARRRAQAAGYTDIDAFLEMESRAMHARELTKVRERRIRFELNRLKEKHGLHPGSNRAHLMKVWEITGDPEIAAFFHIQSTLTMSDTERIAQIRKLFLENKSPNDILYQTAIIVGINLRKKQ